MSDAGSEQAGSGQPEGVTPPAGKPAGKRDRIIDALMELAAEREWNDISLTEVTQRAGVSLADFRDAFPSKGAVLAGLSRKFDRAVLEHVSTDLQDESAKERLFDVLMRRLDAMAPYKLGLEGVADWVRRDPLAASALNRVAINSMRFMLEAAGIDTEKHLGSLKIQGLVFAWARVLNVWFKDDQPGLSRTMAALDRELNRGETLSARLDDFGRLLAPARLMARGMMNAGQRFRERRDPTPAERPLDETYDPV